MPSKELSRSLECKQDQRRCSRCQCDGVAREFESTRDTLFCRHGPMQASGELSNYAGERALNAREDREGCGSYGSDWIS